MNILSRCFACICVLIGFSAAARAEVPLPDGTLLKKVDFERHVMGLFGKTGCASGSCHGSFQGKYGFRLSLFGYEPERDFAAITRDVHGRRLNPTDPDASLLLLKAIGATRHEGGPRFAKDSWQYAVFREWIAAGMPWTKNSGQVTKLTLNAPEFLFCPQGKKVPVRVSATFADGSTEDITPFCDFRINDDSVATISPFGEIAGVKPGDTGIVVSYRGNVAAARVLVPMAPLPGLSDRKTDVVNFVDREVQAKLKLLNMVPSDPASDTEFLRRVTIDTIGSLPSPDEVRAFLADTRADKRTRKIDQLLSHPLHSALWATKLSDITGNNTDAIDGQQNYKPARSQMWHDWLRRRIDRNVPYDQIVSGILLATSRDDLSPEDWVEQQRLLDDETPKFDTAHYAEKESLDLFWRRQVGVVPPDIWGQKVAAAFLGVRLECAECHKHPTDRWTQTDYRSFANFFSQVNNASNIYSTRELKPLVDTLNAERKAKVTNNNQVNLVREMFVLGVPKPTQVMMHPESGKALDPKTLGGPVVPFRSGDDVRKDLFGWMVKPDNPFFAKSFVNRVWAHYYGIGLVDPVDDFSIANPPTNGRLLNALAEEFIRTKFDIRALERTILLSRTYQSSSVPNATNKFDRNNFARSYIRPMMAEVVVDVMNVSLGVTEKFGPEAPEGKRMIEVGTSRFNNASLSYVLRIFGRPARTTACDCERSMEPALPQTLYRMTDPNVLEKMKQGNNRVGQLVKAKKDDDACIEELFLATLSRLPTTSEQAAAQKFLKTESNRLAALSDMTWALINTREYVLNH